MYANTDNVDPRKFDVPYEKREEIDKWLLSKYNKLVKNMTEAFDEYGNYANTVNLLSTYVATDKTMEDTEVKQVVSSDIASTIKSYMKYLVDNNLYRWPAFEGTNAGGKTGTADYKLPDGTDAVPHAWFISAAPIEDPQIAVAVIVDNGESGAVISAGIASYVVRKAVLGY